MTYKNSIMVKMVLLFLAAAIPLYAVGLGIYSICGQQIVNEILGTKRSQMEYYVRSMQDELNRVVMLEAMVLKDSDLGSLANRYSYFSDYERGRRINALRKQLVNIRLSSAYVQTVTAYMLPLGKKLNDYSGLDAMSEEDLLFAKGIAQNAGKVISTENDGLYAAISLMDGEKQLLYALTAQLSASQLRRDLEQLESGVPSQSIMVFDGESVLACTNDGALDLWRQAYENQTEESVLVQKLILNGARYYVTSVYSSFARITLINFIRESDLLAVSLRYLPYLLALTGAVAVLMIVLVHGTKTLVHRPLKQLAAAFREIQAGNLSVSIEHHRRDEFRDVYQSFNQMARMLDQYINCSIKQELLLRRSEILQLQAQINPHFLYNSYFMLHRMVKRKDWQNAERFSAYMGEYFRYITRNADQLLPLEKEAEHARIYSEIQEMRFGGRIRVDFGDVPENLRSMSTPKLILQPVLENAFEHGLRDTEEDGLVRVRFSQEKNGCVITVEDNGDALSDEKLQELIASLDDSEGETTALRNICHRLRLRQVDGLGFELSRSSLGGLCVKMTLCEKEERYESSDC